MWIVVHGVGASCVNALSEWLELEVYCNKKIHSCRFEKGKIVTNMHEIGTYDETITGTNVTFKPANEFWKDEFIDYKVIVKRLQQLAYLNPNITFHVEIDTLDHNGEEIKIIKELYEPDGINSYIKNTIGKNETIIPIINGKTVIDKWSNSALTSTKSDVISKINAITFR